MDIVLGFFQFCSPDVHDFRWTVFRNFRETVTSSDFVLTVFPIFNARVKVEQIESNCRIIIHSIQWFSGERNYNEESKSFLLVEICDVLFITSRANKHESV